MKEEETAKQVATQTKQLFKENKQDDLRKEINKIDILPIVMDTR
jgi:hypothetical protein